MSTSAGVGGSPSAGVGGSPPVGVGGSPPVGVGGSPPVGVGGGPSSEPFVPDKVDLLFVVDNSGGMAEKQRILSGAAADLVAGLANPPCVDPSGNPAPSQPSSGLDACPSGTSRVRPPVTDMHVGVISSSLGGHGSSACTGQTPERRSEVDMAHLLARSSPSVSGNDLETYANRGFLKWDPAALHSPPGEADIAAFNGNLQDMIRGVGAVGCGYESTLESFYRFLADPTPYATLTLDEHLRVSLQGVDHDLLEERKSFLRPDSLLIIVMLSDENDCSIRDFGTYWLAAEVQQRLWRPRSECAIDPNDPCCKSCKQTRPGDGCPADPSCFGPDGQPALLSEAEDPINLRCFDQKRRFGFDFLYPIERYTEALTSATITTRDGDIVANPLFSDLDPTDGNSRVRRPEHVVLAGIVGVPWQDLARDPGDASAGLKTAAELRAPVAGFGSTWDIVLGNPASYIPPADPLMKEARSPRFGANPVTGDPLAPPGQVTNPINGSEYTTDSPNGDLQYACVFGVSPRTCDGSTPSCACVMPGNDSPICGPNQDGERVVQIADKAYPGIRQLDLIKRLGDQGIASSVCPAQLDDASTSRLDYGYRPTVRAILERASTILTP